MVLKRNWKHNIPKIKAETEEIEKHKTVNFKNWFLQKDKYVLTLIWR